MWLAVLEDDLIGADACFAQLQSGEKPRQSVRRWLPSHRRPSIVSGESMLENLGLAGSDPLEFLDEPTGAHVLMAFDAYVAKRYDDALRHLGDAATIGPLNPGQRTLEGVCLLNLDRTDEADRVLADVVTGLASCDALDDIYLRLFCQLHRPSAPAAGRASIRAQAKALERSAALRNFFPVGDEVDSAQAFDAQAVKSHFTALRAPYPSRLLAFTPDGSP